MLIARGLVGRVVAGSPVLADADYDSAPLYQAVHRQGAQLLTRLKGMAQSPDQLRRMGVCRRTALALWQHGQTAQSRNRKRKTAHRAARPSLQVIFLPSS